MRLLTLVPGKTVVNILQLFRELSNRFVESMLRISRIGDQRPRLENFNLPQDFRSRLQQLIPKAFFGF
jgi:hypothetical protein